MTERYVIAADGGNSKTDLVLADTAGRVLARVRTVGTRPHLEGFPATARLLVSAAEEARQQAGIGADAAIAAATYYLANVDLPEHEVALHAELASLQAAGAIRVRNDVFAILRAGTTRNWGVAVTAGAGINAIGVHPGGREARFLALGDITGDWGGGYSVGVAGLGAAVRAGDGRGPATALRELVEEAFEAPAETVAIDINHGHRARHELHALAPGVFRAALDGDRAATAIVDRLGAEVVDLAGALLRRLELATTDAHVVLGGSLLQSRNAVLLDGIRSGLAGAAPRAEVRVLDAPPVVGALVDALDLAGAAHTACAAARAVLG